MILGTPKGYQMFAIKIFVRNCATLK